MMGECNGRFTFPAGAPAHFSVAAAPGNYRVTVTLGGARATRTTIKAESRRLMLDAVAVPAGGSVTRSFIVNVRNAALVPPPANAPGGDRVRHRPTDCRPVRSSHRRARRRTCGGGHRHRDHHFA